MRSIHILGLLSYAFFQATIVDAQVSCGTPTGERPRHIKMRPQDRSVVVPPEVLKVFIHVVAHSDGSYAETDMDSLSIQYELMQQHFSQHGICFILAGIDVIYNTDLDTQFVFLEESELIPYLIPDVINIFIHNWLGESNGTSYGGNAYSIPNPFLSLWELAVVDPNAMTTLTHEMGHCLGLYHTHEGSAGFENVDRTGSCKNCETTGDVLCDTPADPDLSVNGMMNNCSYSGTGTDACGDLYTPDPQNIMSYAPGYCTTYFTFEQGERMQWHLDSIPELHAAVAPFTITFSATGSWTTGTHIYLAEETVTLNSASLAVLNSAQVTLGAGNAVTVYPGTTFQPQSGFARLFAENVCQGD